MGLTCCHRKGWRVGQQFGTSLDQSLTVLSEYCPMWINKQYWQIQIGKLSHIENAWDFYRKYDGGQHNNSAAITHLDCCSTHKQENLNFGRHRELPQTNSYVNSDTNICLDNPSNVFGEGLTFSSGRQQEPEDLTFNRGSRDVAFNNSEPQDLSFSNTESQNIALSSNNFGNASFITQGSISQVTFLNMFDEE